MIFNDPKVNNGLPEGMTLNDLQCGIILETKWNDKPAFLRGLVVEIERRQATFKGEFSIHLFDGVNVIRCVNTQIVQILKDKSHFQALLNE